VITNPLLEEIWAIKDRLDAESGGDIHVFCEQLHAWTAEHLPEGVVLHDPEEIRSRLAGEAPLLREKPPEYGETRD